VFEGALFFRDSLSLPSDASLKRSSPSSSYPSVSARCSACVGGSRGVGNKEKRMGEGGGRYTISGAARTLPNHKASLLATTLYRLPILLVCHLHKHWFLL